MAAESGRQRGEPAHQVGELSGAQRLVAVAQRLLGCDVDIDEERVGAGGDRGQR